jgi:hypothetical protein
MAIVAALGTVSVGPICLVTLVAGGHVAFVLPVVLVVSVTIMDPTGPGGRPAACLSKMALGTFFARYVAV